MEAARYQPTTQKQLHVANNISCVFLKFKTTAHLNTVSPLIVGHSDCPVWSLAWPASPPNPSLPLSRLVSTIYLHILMILKIVNPGQPWPARQPTFTIF